MSISDDEITRDAFLGGRLTLSQPRRGYRAGVDPVILAACVPARAGQSVLELGCGAGAALFCLGTRVPGLDLWGVELQPVYAGLALQNARENGIPARILQGDVAQLPPDIRARRFDHVIANPPYYAPGTGTGPREAIKTTAHREARPLSDWIASGARRLAPRGTMSVIQRADRMGDLLAAMQDLLGSIRVRPLQPRAGRDASLVVIQGVKGGRAALALSAPVTMHEGPVHLRDGEDYSACLESVLRDGAPLNLPGN